jgi:hypothetical protein
MHPKDMIEWVKDSYAKRGRELSKDQILMLINEMLSNINEGHVKIGEFLWHPSHEDASRLQLVPEWIHHYTPHPIHQQGSQRYDRV